MFAEATEMIEKEEKSTLIEDGRGMSCRSILLGRVKMTSPNLR